MFERSFDIVERMAASAWIADGQRFCIDTDRRASDRMQRGEWIDAADESDADELRAGLGGATFV